MTTWLRCGSCGRTTITGICGCGTAAPVSLIVPMLTDGPVHHLDAGRYFAAVADGVPMIYRADHAGAILYIEPLSPRGGTTTDAERPSPESKDAA